MVKAGLEDIVAASSAICDVNGTEGRLIYRGYDIHDLAEHSSFEEVTYLLWNGSLPGKEQLAALDKELKTHRRVPAEVVKAMKEFPKDAMPMEVLRTAVSMLSMYDPDAEDSSQEANSAKLSSSRLKFPPWLLTGI